ncbi:LysR family transcriptional regulator [Pseudomonas sp. 39004]|uniref:LysR family transcriptional regulator n=1 Tax=Pseudomonas sp. 39004 TaxID=2967213 RepID=UPI0023640C60|nr:LysR family transcriptional regulator [Pseudomonas sp. 39004]MDD1962119.1 LysR family transcriptional regulator [Pseudomonas sp. 39004]
MDKLLAMKMFAATVDAQGFSAAARKLGLATSSVTRLVDALEAELGATLLNRSTRQVSLTEAGARYYARARGIFEALDEADASVADRGEEPVGVLRLCLPVEFGRRVIAPHLGAFLARHPALELDIDLSDRLDDLLDGRYDLSIRLGDPAPNDELVCRPLGLFCLYIIVVGQQLVRQLRAGRVENAEDTHQWRVLVDCEQRAMITAAAKAAALAIPKVKAGPSRFQL